MGDGSALFVPRVVWDKMTSEERLAIPVEVRQATRAVIREYNLKRQAKRQHKLACAWMVAECEAWAEYRERERATKLARALSRVRQRRAMR